MDDFDVIERMRLDNSRTEKVCFGITEGTSGGACAFGRSFYSVA